MAEKKRRRKEFDLTQNNTFVHYAFDYTSRTDLMETVCTLGAVSHPCVAYNVCYVKFNCYLSSFLQLSVFHLNITSMRICLWLDGPLIRMCTLVTSCAIGSVAGCR